MTDSVFLSRIVQECLERPVDITSICCSRCCFHFRESIVTVHNLSKVKSWSKNLLSFTVSRSRETVVDLGLGVKFEE
jgi:hypothetical protein